MNACIGISWDDVKRRRRSAALLALVAGAAAVIPSARASAPAAAGGAVAVVVRALPGSEGGAEREVATLGGHVTERIALIDGFAASLPASAVPALRSQPEVISVVSDQRLHMLGIGGYDPAADLGSLYTVTSKIGAQSFWKAGYTGRGVDVALIDSGVVPVNGLTAPGKVINGPDLSFESQSPALQYRDTYGHGTHMAGIIAGRDDAATAAPYAGDTNDFVGVAPDARVVSIKVADTNGATDVSQVLAAIDWVVQHRTDNGLNIRVLNLSFGTDSTQAATLDPIAFAVEAAWRSGIVVVAAAGNQGKGTASAGLSDPAYDPVVLAVGASVSSSGAGYAGDTVATFSSIGTGNRKPDLVAPGQSIESLRNPGSSIDTAFGATATVGGRFFKGSGTSQATAVVSGAAALILQQHPSATPDQVKWILDVTAVKLPSAGAQAQGNGEINLAAALSAPVPSMWPTLQAPVASGAGTLEASRGSSHLTQNGVVLTGEKDIFGHSWSSASMAAAEAAATSWTAGSWNGGVWSDAGWTGLSWSGAGWGTTAWPGNTWAGTPWSAAGLTGMSWSGVTWSQAAWSGVEWSNVTWSNAAWSSNGWMGLAAGAACAQASTPAACSASSGDDATPRVSWRQSHRHRKIVPASPRPSQHKADDAWGVARWS